MKTYLSVFLCLFTVMSFAGVVTTTYDGVTDQEHWSGDWQCFPEISMYNPSSKYAEYTSWTVTSESPIKMSELRPNSTEIGVVLPPGSGIGCRLTVVGYQRISFIFTVTWTECPDTRDCVKLQCPTCNKYYCNNGLHNNGHTCSGSGGDGGDGGQSGNCDSTCELVTCACGTQYCPKHDPAPEFVLCTSCNVWYCKTHKTHSCLSKHEIDYGHKYNPCPYKGDSCMTCNPDHDCRSSHEKDDGKDHEKNPCRWCGVVCMTCFPSHDCRSEHMQMYGHEYQTCQYCPVCILCRPDHLHERPKTHREIYGHDYDECTSCGVCKLCNPHSHNLTGKPVDEDGNPITPQPDQGDGSGGGTTPPSKPPDSWTKPGGGGDNSPGGGTGGVPNISGGGGSGGSGSGDGEEPKDEDKPLQLPALEETTIPESSAVGRLVGKLSPQFSFFSDNNPDYSFRVPLDLSGAPFYAQDYSFTVGGWSVVANGKLAWAMSIIRAISYVVFTLVFIFMVIKSLRQW